MAFSSQEFRRQREGQRGLGKTLIIIGMILLFFDLILKGPLYFKEIMTLLTFIVIIVGIVIYFMSRSLPTKETILVARSSDYKGRLTIPQLMAALDIDESTAEATLNKLVSEGHAKVEETGSKRSKAFTWVFPDIVAEFQT